jgi:hypothetical protein
MRLPRGRIFAPGKQNIPLHGFLAQQYADDHRASVPPKHFATNYPQKSDNTSVTTLTPSLRTQISSSKNQNENRHTPSPNASTPQKYSPNHFNNIGKFCTNNGA